MTDDEPELAADGAGEETEWEFDEGDVVREEHAKPSPVPGESEAPKKEYKVKRRLVKPSDGTRFYHVEKEEGGTHLYSAGAVEGRYEVIDVEESRAFDQQDLATDGGVDTATIDRSCPNGCFDVEVSGGHATQDSEEFVRDRAVSDEGECPHCGEELRDETLETDGGRPHGHTIDGSEPVPSYERNDPPVEHQIEAARQSPSLTERVLGFFGWSP